MFLYLLETANIMYLSFIRFELLSFEHGNPLITQNVKYNLWLFVRVNQVLYHPEVLDLISISTHFVHI